MHAKKRHQVMPFYRNTLNARLSHSPLTCKFNDIPLWQKMNTELWYLHLQPVVLMVVGRASAALLPNPPS